MAEKLAEMNTVYTNFIVRDNYWKTGLALLERCNVTSLKIQFTTINNQNGISGNFEDLKALALSKFSNLVNLEMPTRLLMTCSFSKNDNITFYLPKLQTLISGFGGPRIMISYLIDDVQLFTDILKRAPNIQNFPFINPPTCVFSNEVDITRFLTDLVIHDVELYTNLRHLNLDFSQVSNEDLKSIMLKRNSWKLKTLQITLTPEHDCGLFYRLLKTFESSLEQLNMTLKNGFQLLSSFPDLRNLKIVHVILMEGKLTHLNEIRQLKSMDVICSR